MSTRSGGRSRRSNSRPPQARHRSRGRPQSGYEYVVAPNTNLYHSDESSSECSSDRCSGVGTASGHMYHASQGTRMPRAPRAPGSPTSAPSLDSASDSPSSYASSHPYYGYSSMSPSSDVHPEIFDSSYPYTGAYRRGATHESGWGHVQAPATPAPPKVRPTRVAPAAYVPRPPPQVNTIVADPETDEDDHHHHHQGTPLSPLGGPKAGSYLGVNAPAPEPVVVEVKTVVPEAHHSPGPTAIEARQIVPLYPTNFAPAPPPPQHHHFHVPAHAHAHAHPMSPTWDDEDEDDEDDYDDDYEEDEVRYVRSDRGRGPPRNHVRHVAASVSDRGHEVRRRSRSRPRPRSRPRNMVELIPVEHAPPRRRHRSRSRHHRSHGHGHSHDHRPSHRSRSRPRVNPESEKRADEVQAQIDALTAKLNDIMDDPYARNVIANEGIKFEELITNSKAA